LAASTVHLPTIFRSLKTSPQNESIPYNKETLQGIKLIIEDYKATKLRASTSPGLVPVIP